MKKLVKVHMLPTADTSVICKSIAGLHYTESMISKVPDYINQHLYFTSDEEIKEGDWLLSIFNGKVQYLDKCTEVDKTIDLAYNGKLIKWTSSKHCRKIVATTDKSLTIIDYTKSLDQKVIYLPQIPQQFIEDYCKAGGIDEVYLETEQDLSTVRKLTNGLQT